MKIERIDHIHIKTDNLAKTCAAMEQLTGAGSLMQLDFSKDQGNMVGYSPFPVGLEIMQGTADVGSGVITNQAEPGVFAVSLKVADLADSVQEMKGFGYECVWEGAFGGIAEALFDTRKAFGFMIELIGFDGDDVTAVDNGGAVEYHFRGRDFLQRSACPMKTFKGVNFRSSLKFTPNSSTKITASTAEPVSARQSGKNSAMAGSRK